MIFVEIEYVILKKNIFVVAVERIEYSPERMDRMLWKCLGFAPAIGAGDPSGLDGELGSFDELSVTITVVVVIVDGILELCTRPVPLLCLLTRGMLLVAARVLVDSNGDVGDDELDTDAISFAPVGITTNFLDSCNEGSTGESSLRFSSGVTLRSWRLSDGGDVRAMPLPGFRFTALKWISVSDLLELF